jgi:hypothetical protein
MVGQESHHQGIDQVLEESDWEKVGPDVLKKDHASAWARHAQSLSEGANRIGNCA